MSRYLIAGACFLIWTNGRACHVVQFIPVSSVAPGHASSAVADVSADGTTVVGRIVDGSNSSHAIRWTIGGVPTFLNLAPLVGSSSSTRVSHDGNIIVGHIGPTTDPFRWSSGNPVELLGFLPGNIDDMTPDGSTIIGEDDLGNDYYWTQSGGVIPVGGGAGDPVHSSFAVSDDGQVVVGGFNNDLLNGTDAYNWTESGGFTSIGRLPWTGPPMTAIGSVAYGVSRDGSVIVGASSADPEPDDSGYSSRAFRWTEATGMVDIGGSYSVAYAVNPNGKIVVGATDTASAPQAFLWSVGRSLRSIPELVENSGYDLTGWQLQRATALSANGRVIIGDGLNPLGQQEGWVVILDGSEVPEPSAIVLAIIAILAGAAFKHWR